ncbi:MAG: GAF domain-containing protein [Bacteroidetes bacterium]|nr:GAF domain-containing protein [Bacteroidota bacterium]
MFSTKKQADIYSNKLFANVDKKKVKFKFSLDKLLTYKEGDIVFKKGDKTNYIYLIMEGEVKIKIPDPPFAPKIKFKYKNDFFGEKELLEKSERKSSCVAEKNCQLYPITYHKLQKLILESTVVKDNLEMVTISTVGKTLKEITKESISDKKTEEIIDYQKAIKIHPEEPITSFLTDNIKEADITLENIFKTDEKETKKDIFIDETNNTKQNILPDINITEELRTKNDIVEPLSEKTIEEHKTTEKEKPAINTSETNEELPSQGIIEEIVPEGEKISDEKYIQIIDAGLSLLKITNVDELTHEIVKQATELINADRSIIFIINEDDKMLEAKINSGDNGTTDLKIPLNDSIIGLCALRNKIVIIDDVSKDDRFNPIYDEVFNYKTKNLLVVPIADKDENVVAVLELINSNDETFTEIDVNVLQIFIKSILFALSNCTKIKNLITETNEGALTNVSKYIYRDIKNPLLTIKHYANILIKDKLPEEIKQVLQLIIKQTDFVDSLNDNLSTFSEYKVNLSLEEVSFKEALNDILGLLAEYAESRNIVLYKKIDVETKVNLDSKQFTIACYQIIKNACDAQTIKGSVYITATLVDETVNIEFKDSGEGVPVDSQEEIFKKFTSYKTEEHLGIGLNIVDKIVKAHDGNLIISNSSDGGAIFTISLPVVNE